MGFVWLDLEKDEMNVISINSGLQNKTVLSMSFDALNNPLDWAWIMALTVYI